jgi:hypothetical protein
MPKQLAPTNTDGASSHFAWPFSLRVRAIKSAGGPKEGEGRRRGEIKGDQTPIFDDLFMVRYKN